VIVVQPTDPDSPAFAGSLPDAGNVRGIAFSPDSRHVATTAGLYDATTGDDIRELDGGYSVTFSSDGNYLAVGSGYELSPGLGTRLFDPVTGELIRAISGEYTKAVAFNPDSTITATGGRGLVQLWDATHGGHIRDITGNNLLAFSPDGKLLTADKNGALRLCDPITGATIRTLTGAYAKTAAFSPDGTRIAAITPNNVAAIISL
jgi:WD40 repeat protein